jgi:hypothetical protein
MPRLLAPFLVSTILAALAPPAAAPTRQFQTWRLEGTRFEAFAGAGDAPMPVGSLQKPFVAKAWAAGHRGLLPPRVHCPAGPGCWNRSGHGDLGLVQAMALSCNTYFRRLAVETRADLLAATFAEAGFLGELRSADAAVGLFDGNSPVVIRPSSLLNAYLGLIQTPWTRGEDVRRLVLAGLRETALTGTARSLGQHGIWAKTGTLPVDPLRTCGLALVVNDAGRASLGRLEPGTGREAAEALATPMTSEHRGTASPGNEGSRITVRVFELLRGRPTFVRNVGVAPLPCWNGFLGPGARVALQAGQWAGPGQLELQEPRSGLIRRFRGRIACRSGADGKPALLLDTSRQDYAAGVLAAELATPADPRRLELGAAVLRFLARGPRHPDADVCDSTHCAWFVGQGPQSRWPTPELARSPSSALETPSLQGQEWEEMQAKARQPGPSQWTSHCGGQPLSSHTVWGSGNNEALPCPRHHGGQTRAWQRTWTFAEAEQAFTGPIESITVDQVQGIWVLRVSSRNASKSFSYDDAHRRFARGLGWGALPSPADTVVPVAGGFMARGVGLGHRVGLCLGD